MLGLLLALTASLVWGGASVFGGLAARSASPVSVAWWFSFMALPGMVVLAFTTTGTGGFTLGALLVGSVAGSGAVLGGTLLFLGFTKAAAASVVPTSGFISALLPVGVAATIGGEDLSPLAWVGVVLALGAIWLVASDGERFDARGVWYGLASGAAFGIQFAVLGLAGDGTGLWPVVGVFIGATVVGSLAVLVTRSPVRLGGGALKLTAGGSACSIVANTSYLYATRLGPLSVAAILGALYAIPTVLLAAIFLRERMLPRHWAGLALAGLATAFVAL
jgi:drug/metabolite transporter (DMT)-like permease